VRELFGVCQAYRIDVMPQLGATWLRNGFQTWQALEEGDAFDYSRWDEIFEQAHRAGIKVMPLLALQNCREQFSENGHFRFPPKSHQLVKDAARLLLDRYVERYGITHVEVINEPNLYLFFRHEQGTRDYEEFVDKVLIPASEVIREYGCKVVAPSITVEWPADAWPAREETYDRCFNLDWCKKAVDDWLSYHDAWKHIDYFGLHYIKGDTDKPMVPYADNLMPLYDHFKANWIDTGKIEGVWNTEEGLTAVEAGTLGQATLEPWETAPTGQWVPRYFVPVIDWAVRNDWRDAHQYKVFWYHMSSKHWVLEPTALVDRHSGDLPQDAGRAYTVLTSLFEDVDELSPAHTPAQVGFALHPQDRSQWDFFAPHRFTSYTFNVDDAVLIVAWTDLPGLGAKGPNLQATVHWGDRPLPVVERVDYLTGERAALPATIEDGTLVVDVPRKDAPVLYLAIS
jgi:hypothetical protein